jgi:hypothetical protein
MTVCALDPEYPVEVDVTDSPMFANLVTHWQGDSETVVELQGHMYQEIIVIQGSHYESVIEHTRVERRVVSITSSPEHIGTRAHEQMLAYNDADIAATMAAYTAFETTPMRAIRASYAPLAVVEDENFKHFDNIETAWNMEALRLGKKRFRRTRIFCKLVWAAYKTARSS